MKRVFAHIGFSSATALIVINMISVSYVPYITAGLAVLFAASLMLKKYRQALALPLCFGSALFACLLFLCVYYSAVVPALSLSGKTGELSFYINDLPKFRKGEYVYIAKATQILLNGAPQRINLRVVSDKPITADAFCIINADAKFYSLGVSAFDSFSNWDDGIFLTARLKSFSVTDNKVFSPMKFVLLLRNDIIETLVGALKNDIGALSAALITGDRYYLSDELTNSFRFAGVSHLTAVSGLHLGVLTGSTYFVFKRTGVNVKIRSSVIILMSLFYMALAGFSGSVTRAGIMFIAVFGAEFFNRKADALNSLGLAVFLMCLNPFAVCDAGSALSVLSVLSLVTVYPYLKTLFEKAFSFLSNRHTKIQE